MFSLDNATLACQHLPNLPTYHHLTELNLSNYGLNQIDYFPFEHFPNIRTLDLSYNQLTFINPDWSKAFENSIECLNLRHNKLQKLLFLKDFKHLKTLNITENSLGHNERILALDICPTIEHLINDDQEQIEDDRGKQEMISQLQLSPLGNHFNRAMKIEEQWEYPFQPVKFLRAHHQSKDDLINTSVHMCAFEPNTTRDVFATCGGTKVCLVDCHIGEITHLFEVSSLRSSTNRKLKQKTNTKEHFSCLCWMEIEDLKILAVGATNGHIYLLSPSYNLMFGHIELPVKD